MILNFKKNKLKTFLIAFFSLFILFIGFVIYKVKEENRKFREKGIRVNAIVENLSEEGKTNSKQYKMTISMFTEGEKVKEKSDTTGKSKTDQVIDAIFDKINSGIAHGGSYMRLTIDINSDSYNHYKPGDRIKVVYLKEDPTNVKVLSETE